MTEELELLVDDGVRSVVRMALDLGAADFVAGYELDGQVLEAAWADAQIAVVPDDWSEPTPDGWHVFAASSTTATELIDQLKGAN
jgi:hypothetical protein